MNSKSPGKGLAMILQKIKFFINWLNLPPKCPRHGRQHLYAQRMGNEEPSYQCKVKDCTWMSEDWKAKREDYLSDNWR